MPIILKWNSINRFFFSIHRSDADSPKIAIYHAQGSNEPLHVLERLHTKPVTTMKYNPSYEVIVSVDQAGILELWTGAKTDYVFPAKIVSFESKLDTGKFCMNSISN